MEITETQARELLTAPSGQRPRMYADIISGRFAGQRVAIRSAQNLEEHAGTVGAIMVSFTTVADLISRAGN